MMSFNVPLMENAFHYHGVVTVKLIVYWILRTKSIAKVIKDKNMSTSFNQL